VSVSEELERLRDERLAAAERTGRGVAQAFAAMIAAGLVLTFGSGLGIGAGMSLGLAALLTTGVALKNLIHGSTVLFLVGRERRDLAADFPTAIVRRR
jgi:hypothetical protein